MEKTFAHISLGMLFHPGVLIFRSAEMSTRQVLHCAGADGSKEMSARDGTATKRNY